jgi:hypothetical protein
MLKRKNFYYQLIQNGTIATIQKRFDSLSNPLESDRIVTDMTIACKKILHSIISTTISL